MIPPRGTYYLLATNGKPEPAFDDNGCVGVRARCRFWELVTGPDSFGSFDYLDSLVALSESSGKPFGISWSALHSPPDWVSAAGIATVTLGDGSVIVLPNDPDFLQLLKMGMREVGKRYKDKIQYIPIGGLGQPAVETYMARSDDDTAIYANVGFTAVEWQAAADFVFDIFASAFGGTGAKVILTMAKPFPTGDGQAALLTKAEQLLSGGTRFGAMNSGLSADTVAGQKNQIANFISDHALTNPCGFQFVGPAEQNGGLQAILDAGIKVLQGQGYIEITHVDVTPANRPILEAANAALGA